MKKKNGPTQLIHSYLLLWNYFPKINPGGEIAITNFKVSLDFWMALECKQ